MVEAGTLTISGEVLRKAGFKVSGAIAEADTNHFIKEIEGEICGIARYDFVTNYSSLSTIGKELLRLAASSGAAIPVISYSMKYITEDTSRAEAEDRINVLRDFYTRVLGQIIDQEVVRFIKEGD